MTRTEAVEALEYLYFMRDEVLPDEDHWFQGIALSRLPDNIRHKASGLASCLVAHRSDQGDSFLGEHPVALHALHARLPDHTCLGGEWGEDRLGCLVRFNNNADSFEDIRLLLKSTIADLEAELLPGRK